MRIAIVGGGIGGVAATLSLLKEDHDVTLLEQAPALSEVGGGLVVGPNAKKALNYLGAGAEAAELGVAPEEMVFYDMESGVKLFTTRLGDVGKAAHGEYQYTMHRADLLGSMVNQLPEKNVRLNSKVISATENEEGVSVELETGDRLEADLLIGADGIRSRVRALFFDESDPKFTGLLGWRALIPTENAPHITPLPRVRAWFGKGRHVGVYPVRPGKLMNLFAWVPVDEVVRESWSLGGDVTDLRKALASACPELTAIVNSIDEAFITPLYIRDPLPQWHTKRVALLGDSAHPATAAAGQGAAMALEDAVTLGICLRGIKGNDDLEPALNEYQQRRFARTRRMQSISLANLKWMNESDPVECAARNGRFAGITQLDPVGLGMWRWFYAYDVVKEAETPLPQALKNGGLLTNERRRPEARKAFAAWFNAITPEHRTKLWHGERKAYDAFLNSVEPTLEGTVVEPVDAEGVPSLLVGAGDGATLVYFHGGGFVLGSATASVGLASRIATAIKGRVLVPDYRRAPEHPAPAAADDAVRAYRWLRRQPNCTDKVVLLGEEVGAYLALTVATKATNDPAIPVPSAIHVVSPFIDLKLAGESINAAAFIDPWCSRDRLGNATASYIQHTSIDDPAISLSLNELGGLPPLRVYAASDEALLDDAQALTKAAKKAGVNTELKLFEDSVHGFLLFPELEESNAVVENIAQMIDVGAPR